jgi:dipeptidyl aminopeptidase/acylaminoacyl peptidase
MPIEIERFDRPLFLSHGTRDATWSVEMTRRLWERLKQHGRTPEVHLYEEEGTGSAATQKINNMSALLISSLAI